MSRRKIPGITVWQRGNTWAYRVELEPHPLTGARQRPYQGGFATEEEALEAAIEAKKRAETGRSVTAKKIRVAAFMDEWLSANEDNLKPTTGQNYRDNIDAYIAPILGTRWLGELTVPRINAFYKHLRDNGRRKGDGNHRMYEFWLTHQSDRDGAGPTPTDIARACGTNYNAAREAVRRYRRGRVPGEYSAGLSVKSIRNVHVVMLRSLADAVRWGYLHTNPAAFAVLPRERRRSSRKRGNVWTVDQLGAFLRVALQDRYDGMWLLAATTGMRRSELAGVQRSMLDLDAGTLTIEDTRVVVRGRAVESDGKSDAGERDIALDTFTLTHLRRYVERINDERDAFEGSYPKHDYIMVGPEGRPLHPDTITARFNRLVDRAGVPRIRLHDVRHTYATMAQDAGHNVKILSERIGHADTSITMKIYTHRSQGIDRPLAQAMGALIAHAAGITEPESDPLVTDLVTNRPNSDPDEGDPPLAIVG